MRLFFIVTLALVLSSCVTSATVIGQDNCSEINRDRSEEDKIACGNLKEVIAAVGVDVEIAKDISSAVHKKYLSDNQTPPIHEGEDSNLCKENEYKVCSVKEGCTCVQ